MRKLKSLEDCNKMSYIFHKSVVKSAVLSGVICWGSSIRAGDSKKVSKLIKKAGTVLGIALEPQEPIVERGMFPVQPECAALVPSTKHITCKIKAQTLLKAQHHFGS